MFQVLLRIVPPVNKRREMFDVLRCLKGPTECSRGCRGCWVFQDADDEGALTCLVRWDTREQLEENLQSERFRRLLPYIEMSAEPPEVEVSVVDSIGGIGYLVSLISPDTMSPDSA